MKEVCSLFFGIMMYYSDKNKSLKVLDVGSKDNGDNCPDFRNLFDDTNWNIVGLDLEKGKNVDLVSEPYSFPFEDNTFDIVLSNQVMEHVEKPWIWVTEMSRVLKYSGLMYIATTWKFKIHRFPVDCWRILPDGMKVILEHANLKPILYDIEDTWTYGVGKKCLDI